MYNGYAKKSPPSFPLKKPPSFPVKIKVPPSLPYQKSLPIFPQQSSL